MGHYIVIQERISLINQHFGLFGRTLSRPLYNLEAGLSGTFPADWFVGSQFTWIVRDIVNGLTSLKASLRTNLYTKKQIISQIVKSQKQPNFYGLAVCMMLFSVYSRAESNIGKIDGSHSHVAAIHTEDKGCISSSKSVYPDSIDLTMYRKKHFWRAAGETVGFNIGLWAFDRYVLKGHYAYISWNTIKENFRHGFEWDDDHLHTNMFDHPYNGSIFFNAGRSNGFNFWQSELFAIGGSAMWEMFMEKEYPSTNDIIATPVGGAAIGEVLYRASDLIIDDRASGGERFGRELAAFVVNPMRGLTRIFSGDAWRKRNTSGRNFGIPPISVELSLGGRLLTLWDNDEGTKAGIAAEVNIEYGDKFAETTKAPYDYFTFLLEVQGIKSQPLLSRAEIVGRLLSKEIVDKKYFNLNVGLYQHFDFFDSDTIREERNGSKLFPCAVPYKLGAPASVGGGVMFRYKPLPIMRIDGFLHLNGVALAGILTDFYRDYHRNYNWGSGFSIKAGAILNLWNDRVSLRLANQFYKIYTWNGYDPNFDWSTTPEGKPVNIQGDTSNSTFNHFEASLNYNLWKRLYLIGGFDMYLRHTNYDGLTINEEGTSISSPRIESKQLGFHLMLMYQF